MTTKTKKPAFVQLRANKMNDNHIKSAQHRGEVEFYSIYLGEPGSYQWVADFECHTDALYAVHQMVEAFGCEVDRSQYDAVVCAPAPAPQTKGHPHAVMMAEYAKDAAETDKPWERWEASIGPNQPWVPCIGNPGWALAYLYRRKPEPPKTIMVNGFKVPAPLDKVKVGTTVYVADPVSADLCVEVNYVSWYSRYFDRKIVHATREAAVAHAKAMLGIDPKESA